MVAWTTRSPLLTGVTDAPGCKASPPKPGSIVVPTLRPPLGLTRTASALVVLPVGVVLKVIAALWSMPDQVFCVRKLMFAPVEYAEPSHPWTDVSG
jgi:hypothetical protein